MDRIIELAGNIGFCFGVKRAIKIVRKVLLENKDSGVYSMGPIIHNPQVVEDLSKKGLKVLKGLDGIKKGIIVVSSHGIDPGLSDRITKAGFKLIDATCPYVKNAQRIARSLFKEGYTVVIFGDRKHPEVKSLVGYCDGNAIVIKDEKDLNKVRVKGKRVGLIAQTTQCQENFSRIILGIFKKGVLELRIYNTICNDVSTRQAKVSELAKVVDVLVIVGGKMSANTNRLYEICSRYCPNTYHIETEAELNEGWFFGKDRVGIASGASTPDWVIDRVIRKINGL